MTSNNTPKPEVSIVKVENWNSNKYGGDHASETFLVEIEDKRESRGQTFVTISDESGANICPSVTAEISRIPGSNDDLPCFHLHFDENTVAASFFFQNGQFIIRTETGVSLEATKLPHGESAYILK